jgi:RNA polymerase sigma-70 factor (ECF subfamily)
MNEIADDEAIRRCQRGDSRGMEPLIARHQVTALRVAFLLVGDRATAEDVVQEAFVQAWNALPRFRAHAPFAPWFLRIVTNAARMRQRTNNRHPALSLDRLAPETRDTLVNAPGEDPAVHAEAGEMRAAIIHALAELSPMQREAVVLRYYGGYDATEIAQIVGCQPAAARQRVHDGLVALERIIDQRFPWLIPSSAHDAPPPAKEDRTHARS